MEHIVLTASFLLSAMTASVRIVHMFQLSSYQWQGYLRWLKSDAKAIMGFIPVTLIAVLGLWDSLYALYAASALLLFTAFLCRPRRGAKKPLKLTARALRIFTVTFLLLCGAATGAYFAGGRFRLVILAAGTVGVLLLVPFASLLLTPVQKCINRWYIRDAQKRLRPDLTVIGVTGSYGKTSVKTYIGHLLSLRYNVLVTPESYNTPMGVVRTIREKLAPSHSIFVCEMGARHVGDIREVCDIVHPKHGVITAIGPQHLETFLSLDNIVSTKFELINALPDDGIAFLSWGNAHIRQHAGRMPAVRYAVSDDPALDIRAENLSAGPGGSAFEIVTRSGERERFSCGLLGRHNVENVTAAISVAYKLGIPLCEMIPAVRRLQPAPHRLEPLPKGNGLTVIDDAYNANPAGTAAALEALSMFQGVKIVITPGMVELGDAERDENRMFGERIAAVCDYAALVNERQSAPIAEGLIKAGFPQDRFKVFTGFDEAFRWAQSIEAEEKVILLENDLPDNY